MGESKSRNSYEAGREAALAATTALGTAPDALLLFATAGYDQAELFRGVKSAAPNALVSGCSGSGIIAASGSDEGAHAVAVLGLASNELSFSAVLEPGLRADPSGVGRRIGEACKRSEASLALLFPDGLTGNVAALTRAIDEHRPAGVVAFGGTAGEIHRFDRTHQYGTDGVYSDSVSALLIGGNVRFDVAISHGCQLIGVEYVVTRAEGGTVYELNGLPAWHVMREYLDEPTDSFSAAALPYLCLAQALPDDATTGYGHYLIRVPLGLDSATGALFFPGELRQGERLWLARREIDEVVKRAVQSAHDLAARSTGPKPLFVLQADCTGRGRLLFGETISRRVMTPVQRAFADGVPWIGFHSYGEIAPIGEHTYYHNYTMALCSVGVGQHVR